MALSVNDSIEKISQELVGQRIAFKKGENERFCVFNFGDVIVKIIKKTGIMHLNGMELVKNICDMSLNDFMSTCFENIADEEMEM
jgi:hypothetical protein